MAQLHQPRLADIIAARLRSDILSGRYAEGEVLDIAGGVFADFRVSLPAMREAVRVLENEGLLRTRRGSGGGAVVQLPTPRRIGEVIAMVLQSRRTEPADVGRALGHLEPICASMCAERADRHTSVLPDLRRIIRSQRDELENRSAYMSNARAFHDSIVEHCGSQTMVVAAGAWRRSGRRTRRPCTPGTCRARPTKTSSRGWRRPWTSTRRWWTRSTPEMEIWRPGCCVTTSRSRSGMSRTTSPSTWWTPA